MWFPGGKICNFFFFFFKKPTVSRPHHPHHKHRRQQGVCVTPPGRTMATPAKVLHGGASPKSFFPPPSLLLLPPKRMFPDVGTVPYLSCTRSRPNGQRDTWYLTPKMPHANKHHAQPQVPLIPILATVGGVLPLHSDIGNMINVLYLSFNLARRLSGRQGDDVIDGCL